MKHVFSAFDTNHSIPLESVVDNRILKRYLAYAGSIN